VGAFIYGVMNYFDYNNITFLLNYVTLVTLNN